MCELEGGKGKPLEGDCSGSTEGKLVVGGEKKAS